LCNSNVCRNLRSSLDKQTEAEENLKLETTTSKDQEIPQESVAVDSSVQESSSELDLLKKLQVLQNMNPAIKALMNYRGKYTVYKYTYFTILILIIYEFELQF
jgi:hypothetical protein